MTNRFSTQSNPSFFRVIYRALSRTIFGGNQDMPVCQKVPPQLSLVQSFIENPARSSGPNLTWFEAGERLGAK